MKLGIRASLKPKSDEKVYKLFFHKVFMVNTNKTNGKDHKDCNELATETQEDVFKCGSCLKWYPFSKCTRVGISYSGDRCENCCSRKVRE